MDVSNGLKLRIDVDQGSIGIGVDDVLREVQGVIAQLSPNARSALGWLPDMGHTSAGVEVNLNTGAMAGEVTVSTEQGERLATAYLVFASDAAAEEGSVSISLDKEIDLGGTPLFGGLLSGVRISDLAASYSVQPVTAGLVPLPDGSSAPPADLPQGFGLAFTLIAGGSTQRVRLSSQPSNGQDNPPATSHSALNAGGDLVRPAATAESTSAPGIIWFPVQRSFGPLSVDRIGVVLGPLTVGLALDAGLTTDVVTIALTGFVVELAKSPTSVSVSLDGMAVSVSSGSLQIAGSLTRSGTAAGVEYDGSLVIRVAQYAIDAAGSYGEIGGSPSLFVFGLAQGEFGGPPMFFVTGLAAGFGVNRALRLPAPDQVRSFPLIQAATQGAGYLPAPGVQGTQDALAKLASGGWVPPAAGEYWVAAGVAFRSFEVVNGFVVVTVQFGRDLSIALLGIAALKLPTVGDGGPAFAYAEITVEALLVPSIGTFSLTVLVSPNSYVIAPDCHLTGGLAVDIWFGSNPHAGDFVITLGGYHSLFAKPAWYPTVPRLGFQWKLSDAVQIIGESYFAITPSCAMGGGRLSLTFDVGALHAWLIAQTDFIMYWRPFWFELDVMVSIGISYTVNLAFFTATFSVSLGVSIQLWGPPLRGIAHVNWFVISFDIPINGGGSPTTSPNTLADWPTFAATSLPPAPSTTTVATFTSDARPPRIRSAHAPAAVVQAAAPTICKVRAAGGLLAMVNIPGGQPHWLFGGDGVRFTTETAVPADTVVISGPTATTSLSMAGPAVHVYPLGNVPVASVQTVTIAGWTGTAWQPGQALPVAVDVSGWVWTAVNANLPGALWGARGDDAEASLGSAVVAGMTGVTGAAPAPTMSGVLAAPTATLMTDELPVRGLVLETTPIDLIGPARTGDTRTLIAASIVDPTTTQHRADLVAAAAACGLAGGLTSGVLNLFSNEINAVLTAPAMIGALGSTGPAPTPAAANFANPPLMAGSSPGAAAGPRSVRNQPDNAHPADSPAEILSDRPTLRMLIRQEEPTTPANGRPPRTPTASATVWGRHREAGERHTSGAVRLWPGWTAVWDLTTGGHQLDTTGTGEKMLVALDGTQQVLDFRRLGPRSSTHPTPMTATRVAVSHLPGFVDTASTGWTSTGSIRQIASQTFIGDGILIRCQSPSRAGGRRSRHVVGATTAAQVIARNWTVDHRAAPLRGWVDTWLLGPCTALAVTIADDGDNPSPDISPPIVALRSPGSDPVQPTTSRHVETWDGTRLATWYYLLAGSAQDDHIVVRAQAPTGWRLDGVVGYPSMTAQAQDRHPREQLVAFTLRPEGTPLEVSWR